MVDEDHWSRFIVLSSKDPSKPLSKVSPFIIEKLIKGCAGEVKNVTKMKSGCLLIECSKKHQSSNLLKLTKIIDLEILASPHRTLNSSQGIINYRDDDLAELTDEEICRELQPQGVTIVNRFIANRQGVQVKLNTFLLSFNTPTVPQSIKMGLYSVKVSAYIPNPVRCFKYQTFGHGKGQCRGTQICFKCAKVKG